ncbi:hypothetical protein FW755_00225 [Lonepinella koalarum]|uniref:hypothetical protein n=1 Tax=Lonepinella koalarum TaxID=53417 RepID=UPI0011E3FB9A|nr:hypothetical protein [Lonepinella koalarum]TYG33628.1 hypothetical protein FW755_00225 [Lonepinella koalarum]
MKKLVVMALTLFSASVLAVTENVIETTTIQPKATIFVLDTSSQPAKVMKGTQFSRSKARNLCVAVSDVPVQDKNQFVEYFVSPAPINIIAKDSDIKVDDDKKGFLAITLINESEIKNNVVTRCWQFEQNDPVGKYKLDVQFNDIVFKGLSFEVLK